MNDNHMNIGNTDSDLLEISSLELVSEGEFPLNHGLNFTSTFYNCPTLGLIIIPQGGN